jgi:hypothetical protein
MNDKLEQRYGPNWKMVQEYVEQVPCGFLFKSLGRPDEADAKVCRLGDWPMARRVSHYDLREGSSENSDYLRFLVTVHRAAARNDKVARENSLSDQSEQARNDVAEAYAEADDVSPDRDFADLLEEEEDAPYPQRENSLMDHRAYIATELVVARFTDIHLLRDMWYWYQRGHWPCGWEGDWPEGRLIVF